MVTQTAVIDGVILYISETSKRFEEGVNHLPAIPEGDEMRLTEQDLGPATKDLPAVKKYAQEVIAVIFCDDDKIYDCNWAAR